MKKRQMMSLEVWTRITKNIAISMKLATKVMLKKLKIIINKESLKVKELMKLTKVLSKFKQI